MGGSGGVRMLHIVSLFLLFFWLGCVLYLQVNRIHISICFVKDVKRGHVFRYFADSISF